MQGQQQDSTQPGPRFGEDPQPGHWAAGIGGFTGMAYIAHGLDCLARAAGMADGLSVLVLACGLPIGQVQQASREELREWFYRCYAEYSGEKLAGAWDVVAFSSGVHCHDSGWCPPDPPARRPYHRKTAPRLCPGYAAGNHTDGYVMPVLPVACNLSW